jgi:hypothetical protein
MIDNDCTIPQYKVINWNDDCLGFEKVINELAIDGYEVQQISTCRLGDDRSFGSISHTAIMVKRVSRLEVLVKEGKVVK